MLLTLPQILSITCDNASNNDTMVKELQKLSPYFNKRNRTRCFLHVLNLVAKALMKAFELPDKNGDDLNDEEKEVLHLAEGIDSEEETTQQGRKMELESDEMEDDDREEWVDQVRLTEAEEACVRKAMLPITRILIKVSELTTYQTLLKFLLASEIGI
jgi:nucleoside-diphosphate-sugar epimerase